MRFLSMIRHEETGKVPSEKLMQDMGKLIEEMTREGTLISTAGLRPSSEGVRVRSRFGKLSKTDGPFTEAREVIGGYAMLEAKSMGEAIALTERFLRIHGDEWNLECEIRPLDGPECEAGERSLKMKKFMAVYTGDPQAIASYAKRFPSEEARKANDEKGMKAWQKWVAEHGKAIVDSGAPLGRTKRVTKDGIADVRNNLAAWTVVEAESQEAAAKLFLNHPHFTIFPGDGVEIMECLPIPDM